MSSDANDFQNAVEALVAKARAADVTWADIAEVLYNAADDADLMDAGLED